MGLHTLYELSLNQNQIEILPDDIFSGLSVLGWIFLNNNTLSIIPVLPSSVKLLDISYNSFEVLPAGTFSNCSQLNLLNIIGNKIEIQEHMFEGLNNLSTLLTDTPFMCCVKPPSVSDNRCLRDPKKLGDCWFGDVSCKSEGDAISSCYTLIGSVALRTCLWVIGVCALIGNFAVMFYRLFIDTDNLTMSYSFFVLNLSLSDCLMGVYMIVIGIVDIYYNGVYAVNNQTWRRSTLCTTAGVLSSISSEMSTFLILLVTIDRVIVIMFPMSRLSKQNISWKQASVVSVCLWLISTTLAVIPVISMQSYFKGEYYSQSGVCLALPLTDIEQPGAEYSFAVFVCLNCLVFLAIAIGQIGMFKSLISSPGRRMASSQSRQRDISVARTLFMVVATDFCCWFPIGVMGVISKFGYQMPHGVYAWVMVFVLPINAAINPFLYTASAIFRKRQREQQIAITTSTKNTGRIAVKSR
ncbi:G-protein coupled receptor GRL101-like [Pecten maximus]|uniref:G-protein coupled receptor GRL101-like n=1 Tax=Pecten maximus TaxID=6579 RepID=UPI001458938A|nr:G-protein coupled receptor GRL101-like [Pecten maximus]